MNISLKHFVIYQINLNYEINKTHSKSTSWLLVLYKWTWLWTKWSTIKYNTSNRILNNYVLSRCFIAVNDMVMLFAFLYNMFSNRIPVSSALWNSCYHLQHKWDQSQPQYFHPLYLPKGRDDLCVCVYVCVCVREGVCICLCKSFDILASHGR